MVYIECKIWPFSDKITHQKERYKAMKEGHVHYVVNALIDTSSSVNFISKSLADKLRPVWRREEKHVECLYLSLRYKGKDRLLGNVDDVRFEVIKKPKADLVLGLAWLWLYEAKIDARKEGIRIYGDFVSFCKHPSCSETESSESSSSEEITEEIVERYQPEKRKSRCKFSN